MIEGIGWEVLQLAGRQKDHVGEVSEGFETSCPDDSRLDLAVDVLGHRIAGSESVGGQNAGQMGFECLAQALEGLKATASCPGDESAKQGFGLGTGRESPGNAPSCARPGRLSIQSVEANACR